MLQDYAKGVQQLPLQLGCFIFADSKVEFLFTLSVFLCSIQKYLRLVAVILDLQHIPDSKYLCDGLLSFPAFPRAASLLHCWACVSEYGPEVPKEAGNVRKCVSCEDPGEQG